MTTIESTIEKLKILQEILSAKFAVQREIEDLPRTLATKKELVSRLKKAFVEKNERYEETRRNVANLRIKLQEAEDAREKYESQMDQITTAREYDALEKEIRDATDKEQGYRRDLQKEEKDLQEQRQRIEREEQMIKTEEEELALEREKIDSETAVRKSTLTELEKREQEIVPGLESELIFKFERIIRSKAGEGIVPIKNGVCTGCQMILPNQFVNDVHLGEDILFCPYCSKIVFFSAEVTGEDEKGFSDSDEEGLSDLVDDDFDDDLFEDDELVGYDSEDDIVDEEEVEEEEEEEEADEDLLDDDESDNGLLSEEDEGIDDEEGFEEEDDEEELED
ncbi:MAG: nucleic acid-binding protein [Spirochaetaceae bacterium]|nr:MAG: nucleic acid-binding protein [Spirochaetaceae bacterium]